MRQQKRELNKTQRQLTRDQSALERQEKQLVRLVFLWGDPRGGAMGLEIRLISFIGRARDG